MSACGSVQAGNIHSSAFLFSYLGISISCSLYRRTRMYKRDRYGVGLTLCVCVHWCEAKKTSSRCAFKGRQRRVSIFLFFRFELPRHFRRSI